MYVFGTFLILAYTVSPSNSLNLHLENDRKLALQNELGLCIGGGFVWGRWMPPGSYRWAAIILSDIVIVIVYLAIS